MVEIARLGKWAIGIVGGLILLGIGGAIGSSNEGDLKSEVSMLEAQLASAEEERGQAEDKASRIEGLKGKIVGEAQSRASTILSGAKRESEEEKEVLARLRAKSHRQKMNWKKSNPRSPERGKKRPRARSPATAPLRPTLTTSQAPTGHPGAATATGQR